MRLPFSLAFACAAVVLCGSARVAEPPKSPPLPATIADIAWLAGHWEGEGLGGVVEDAWMPPRAGVMLGSSRLVKPDGKKGGFYELAAIEEHEGTLRLVSEHFSPDWSERRARKKALRLQLTGLSESQAVFGHLSVRQDGPDARIVEYTLKDKAGAPRVEVIRLTRRSQPSIALAP